MPLFGKKKKTDEQDNSSAENKNSSVSDEMKIILEAREEEQQERKARAEERQQVQEQVSKEMSKLEEQSLHASKALLEGMVKPSGMTFFVIVDEIPVSAVPEKEGNIVIRGNIRGTAKTGMDVYLVTDCLINTKNIDISEYKQGSLEDFYHYIGGTDE